MHGDSYDLVDPFGRTIRDLRISVTDRCNFRCTYCMPAEGMQWLPREDLLTFEELERLARIFVERFHVDGIRLTGGEPTVRAHLPVLVSKLARLRLPASADTPLAGQKPDLSITTNGATFRLLAHELRDAGLDRVNVSLDSLRRERFLAITRRDDLERVLDGIEAAQEAGFDPVKVNCVVERGVNDDEIVDLATWGRDAGVSVRFIEFMPLDASGAWDRSKVVGQDEIVAAIDAAYPLVPAGGRGSGACRSVALRRREGRRRRHPQCHEAVLRRLRPGAAHRRGSVPHLPVRDPGVRPPGDPAPRWQRRRAGAGDRAGRGHQVGRACHRPGHVPPAEALDEPDRRLNPAFPGAAARSVPALAGAGIRCSAPREL